MFGQFAAVIACAHLMRLALFVRDGAWIDAKLVFHQVAMRHRRPVLDGGALMLLIRRRVDRSGRSDGRKRGHLKP